MATYDVNKLTKLGALKQLAERVKEDYTTKTEFGTLNTKVSGIDTDLSQVKTQVGALEEAGGQPNVIESVKVNNSAVQVGADKSVNITVPTNTNELENGAGFQNATEVTNAVTAGINDFATKATENGTIDSFKELVDYVAEHQDVAGQLVSDMTKAKSDIEGLTDLVGEDSVSEQIEDALTGYVPKDGDKVLSTNDYTAADKAKVDTIDYASDEDIAAMLNEVFAAE